MTRLLYLKAKRGVDNTLKYRTGSMALGSSASPPCVTTRGASNDAPAPPQAAP